DYDDDFINTKSFTKVRTSKKNKVEDERFWLLSPKTNKALNTQFKRNNKVQMHPDSGYRDGEKVLLTSEDGELELEVILNDDLRSNCVVVTSNTLGLNILTPTMLSDEGESACYQEVKVTVEKIESYE
ncbi:MAG: molybdopterin oxidoreductase, partial [Epsilonproteobacteria bacterium]